MVRGQADERGFPVRQTCLTAFAFFSFLSTCYAETGLASYYGYGKGRGDMTCAHRTRPFGSVLTVSYAGRTIQCRVADRGPFIKGRIIDLSVSAARALRIIRAGVVHVSVD
jgi:rare lipoprotein A